ncbi:hypothetical protein K523DRAFT_116598 [Schizophyllum commune Tattone D]|nr:hypothetical protein K523DRAFT_116598 [Schizophyllum commune Tattone D]
MKGSMHRVGRGAPASRVALRFNAPGNNRVLLLRRFGPRGAQPRASRGTHCTQPRAPRGPHRRGPQIGIPAVPELASRRSPNHFPFCAPGLREGDTQSHEGHA